MSEGVKLHEFALRTFTPLALVVLSWVIMGTSLHRVLDLVLVTFIVSFLMGIGWAAVCTSWFSLSRRAALNVPLALTAVLIVGALFAAFVFKGGWTSLGLNSSVAIVLRSTLQILTVSMSLVFILSLLLSDVGVDAEEE